MGRSKKIALTITGIVDEDQDGTRRRGHFAAAGWRRLFAQLGK